MGILLEDGATLAGGGIGGGGSGDPDGSRLGIVVGPVVGGGGNDDPEGDPEGDAVDGGGGNGDPVGTREVVVLEVGAVSDGGKVGVKVGKGVVASPIVVTVVTVKFLKPPTTAKSNPL